MGKRTLGSLARLGRIYGPELILALGFPRGRGPVKSILSCLLRRIDPAALEAALSRWLTPRLPEGTSVLSGRRQGPARQSRRRGPRRPPRRRLRPQAQAVLGQVRVDSKTNEHEAALELLGILPLEGEIVIGDDAFCRRGATGGSRTGCTT